MFQPRQSVTHKGNAAVVIHRCAVKSAKGEDRYVVQIVNRRGKTTTVVALASNLKEQV